LGLPPAGARTAPPAPCLVASDPHVFELINLVSAGLRKILRIRRFHGRDSPRSPSNRTFPDFRSRHISRRTALIVLSLRRWQRKRIATLSVTGSDRQRASTADGSRASTHASRAMIGQKAGVSSIFTGASVIWGGHVIIITSAMSTVHLARPSWRQQARGPIRIVGRLGCSSLAAPDDALPQIAGPRDHAAAGLNTSRRLWCPRIRAFPSSAAIGPDFRL
jgi:hypothetical protein